MKLCEVCSCEAEFEINADLPVEEVVALLTQWRDHHHRNCPDQRHSPRGGNRWGDYIYGGVVSGASDGSTPPRP